MDIRETREVARLFSGPPPGGDAAPQGACLFPNL
jgi:hypothetical protein